MDFLNAYDREVFEAGEGRPPVSNERYSDCPS